MNRRFQRRIENFVCESCGAQVSGNGYTNHCPRCLVSKHVDVHPGDRASDCRGVMHPVDVTGSVGEEMLVHQCERCGARRKNRIASEDDRAALERLAQERGM